MSARQTEEAVSTRASDAGDDWSYAKRTLGQRLFGSSAFLLTLAVLAMALFFGVLSDGVFFRVSNLFAIGLGASQIMFVAAAMSFILGARELDLSVGANLILSSVVMAKVITTLAGTPAQVMAGEYPNLSVALVAGFLAGVATGGLFGATNGLLVTRLGISSFIVTLGTTGIGTGIALVLTGGSNVPYLPRVLQLEFGIRKVFGVVPLPLIVVVLFAAVLWWIMTATRFGMRTLAIGSSREAAARAGINVKSHLFRLFMMTGLIVGVAAFLVISRFGTTNVSGNQTFPLEVIAATVMGGTSMFGGIASVGGALIGAIVPALVGTGLVILRIEAFYQLIVVGVVLILAVYADYRRRESLG